MLLGLGRGPPGRGPPGRAPSLGPPGPGRPAGRGPAGRGPPVGPGAPEAGAPGAAGLPACGARGAAPMPVAVELNGLLPGLGPGRGAPRWPPCGAVGRGPATAGRGAAGRGVAPSGCGRCAGLVSAGGTCGPTLWSCGNGTAIFGLGRGAAGGSGSVTGCAGCDGGGCGAVASMLAAWPFSAGGAATSAAALARPFAAPRVAAAFPAPSALVAWLANSSLSLRTTGASMVEDADLTNSPISWSLAITALLSTPNSLASSYTRTFATALLYSARSIPGLSAERGRACSVRRQIVLFIAACSSSAHRNSASFRLAQLVASRRRCTP